MKVEIVTGDTAMKRYCLQKLNEYDDKNIGNSAQKLSLKKLIEKTVEKGTKMVINQTGWGLRYVLITSDVQEIINSDLY